MSIRTMVLDHDRKLDGLLAWRSEIRGVLGFMKLAFGTSVLAAVASIVAIAALLAGHK